MGKSVRYGAGAIAALAALAVAQPAAALEITFSVLPTAFNSNISIDYYEPTNSLVASSFYPNGNPRNFEIIQQNGAHVQHSAVAGMGDEIDLTAVRSTAHGGFGSSFAAGTVFSNTDVNGQILRINPDGTSSTFSLPSGSSAGKLNGALHVDRTGVWNGDLIATTTTGQVWRIDGAGNATNVANIGGVIDLEAAITIANDAARYGALAGKILATDEFNSRLYAIGTNGSVQYWTVSLKINDMDLIVANENLFGVNYGTGRILGADASQFVNNIGDILVAQEFSPALGLLKWNFNTNAPEIEAVTIGAGSPTIGQWEHMTFAPAGLGPIPAIVTTTAVPEPALTPALFGLAGLFLLRQRRRAAA